MADAIEKLRSQIDQVRAELERVGAAPRTADETHGLVHQWLAHIEANDHNPLRHFADARTDYAAATRNRLQLEPLTLRDLVAIFGPDDLTSRIVARIAPDSDQAIPAPEREKKIAALTKKLHGLEVDEEKSILAAERPGEFIPRRNDASIAALLEAWQ